MIKGAALADYGVLVISAKKDEEFEASLESQGEAREHVQLSKSLGINKLIILVNKMDDPDIRWQ